MAHDCVDWSVRPPVRKTPFVVLSRGDQHVYALVPKDLQTLVSVARQEFDLGDVDVYFTSSCLDLCHGRAARITEHAWEHLSPYIGCATVEVSRTRRDSMTPLGRRDDRRGVSAPEDADDDEDADDEDENEDEEGSPPRSRRAVSASAPRDSATPRQRSADRHPSQPPTQPETHGTAPPEHADAPPDPLEKLLIRVAHPLSMQESKFTTKGTTRVSKVLVGACKSFGLDPSQAALYLVKQGQTEGMVLCDVNDTIAEAGAERDGESRFALKMAGDA